MTALRVQSILFHNAPLAIRRALDNLHRAADLAIAGGDFSSVEVVYGDCSPLPVFNAEAVAALREEHLGYLTIGYEHFGKNFGSAKGHNRLLDQSVADFVLIMNPDVVVAPNTLSELKRPFDFPAVGMVEARQLPVEHPKRYDAMTGETGWATTACALIPRHVFQSVGGFDDGAFFLYCDDVDFSWRVRLAGMKVIYQPSAVVFHDKRLSNEGAWMPTSAEKYYSAEAALMLTYKWSRPDLTEATLSRFKASGESHIRNAAKVFEARRAEGSLPIPVDLEHRVGEFVGDMYSVHRFVI